MRTVLSVAALLLAIASSARAQSDASPSPDAMPEAGGVGRPGCRLRAIPGGQVIAQNRDSIQAHYSRQLQSLPPDFRITVQARIVEGQIVIDQEHFTGMPAERSQATWMYLVRDGLIRRAWALDGKPTPAP